MPGSTAIVTKSDMVRSYEQKNAKQRTHYERMQARVEEMRTKDQQYRDHIDRRHWQRMDAADKRRKEIMDAKLGIGASKKPLKRSSDVSTMFTKKPLNRQLSRSANDVRKYDSDNDSECEYDEIKAFAKRSLRYIKERSNAVYKSAIQLSAVQEVKQCGCKIEKKEDAMNTANICSSADKAEATAPEVARLATPKEATVSTKPDVETSSRNSLGSYRTTVYLDITPTRTSISGTSPSGYVKTIAAKFDDPQNIMTPRTPSGKIAVSVNQSDMNRGSACTTSVNTTYVDGESKPEILAEKDEKDAKECVIL